MSAGPSTRFCARIDRAPGALERLLQPFTVIGAVPRNMVLRPAGAGGTFVVMEIAGPDAERCAVLAERLRQMPCVHGVRFFCLGSVAARRPRAIDALCAVA